jgi:hypothetical protein
MFCDGSSASTSRETTLGLPLALQEGGGTSESNLILATILTADWAQAQTLCSSASSSLAQSAQQMLNLARAGRSSGSSSGNSSVSMRAPANNYNDNGSDQSPGQGQDAIFNWFNKNASRSRGLCTKGVRMAMQAGGWWPCGEGLGMAPQTDAGPNLLRNGFKKISLRDPSQAKPGTILIYKGVCSRSVDKNSAYGHIEMRTKTGYASDFMSSRPISTYNKCRQFKEAYVKVGPPGKACYQTMGGGSSRSSRRR